MHELLVNRLFKPAQEKVWLGELTVPVDLGCKATKTNKQIIPFNLPALLFNPLYTGNPSTGSLAKGEDPDEMQHNAAFHQGQHCLLRLKQPSGTELTSYFRNSTCDPLKCKIGSPILIEIHQNTKDKLDFHTFLLLMESLALTNTQIRCYLLRDRKSLRPLFKIDLNHTF